MASGLSSEKPTENEKVSDVVPGITLYLWEVNESRETLKESPPIEVMNVLLTRVCVISARTLCPRSLVDEREVVWLPVML